MPALLEDGGLVVVHAGVGFDELVFCG